MEVEINQSNPPVENELLNSISNVTENALSQNSTCNKLPSDITENCAGSPIETLNNSLQVIIEQLASNDKILCKSQQRDEEDINKEEKIKILLDIFEKSKSNFLSRFGQFLSSEQAAFFEQYQDNPNDGYEVVFHLKNISQMHSKTKRHRYLRNKRFAALKRLEKNSYFSETEMMKRNPLLYEQLVGQYLTATEKKIRDHQDSATRTFVGCLMQGIEKEQTELKRKQQEDEEDAAMDEEDSEETDSSDTDDEIGEPKPSTSKPKQQKKPPQLLWGEFLEDGPKRIRPQPKNAGFISAEERKLLKEEFVSVMYQSFLDGEDEEFDYDTVDNNDEYDNIEILEHDEEEKYFDSEEPEDMTMGDGDTIKVKEDSSEDELDMYMNALNQHPAVSQLSEDIKRL